MNQNRDQKNLMHYFRGIMEHFIRMGKRLIICCPVVQIHLGPLSWKDGNQVVPVFCFKYTPYLHLFRKLFPFFKSFRLSRKNCPFSNNIQLTIKINNPISRYYYLFTKDQEIETLVRSLQTTK